VAGPVLGLTYAARAVGADGQDGLPPPVVPPDAYDVHYFLEVCGGAEEWRTSGGRTVAGVYPGALALARLEPGEVVVDLGTGRGELLVVAVEMGAARAIGVEYAHAAVDLARDTIAVHGVGDKAEVLHADTRAAPVPDETADLVTLLDVVEHLAPDELERTLREARRLLRPGGRVFIHTFPTRTLYDVTYRLQRLSRPSRWRRWPADPRKDVERALHVNEQSAGSLRRALRRAGFTDVRVRVGDLVYADFVPDPRARRLYERLAAVRPLKRFGASNLFAEGVRPA